MKQKKINAEKKMIIMGLHENQRVDCDLETAKKLETEGIIEIGNYYEGVLYGELDYGYVIKCMFDWDEGPIITDFLCEGDAWGTETIIKLVDKDYVCDARYLGGNYWEGSVNWDRILCDFCKCWDYESNEAV